MQLKREIIKLYLPFLVTLCKAFLTDAKITVQHTCAAVT